MTVVVTFERYRPPARYDSLTWTEVRIEEASEEDGAFTLIDTVALSPVDADPTDPDYRSFTTELGTDEDYWYRIVFADASGDVSAPTSPVQNTAGTGFSVGEPYADTTELFRRLKIRTPTGDQTAAADRMLITAAGEIQQWMAREEALADWELQLVTEVNLERAAELWHESEVPFGALGLDSPSGPVFVSRHSRALAKLNVVRQGFGVA